MTSITSHNNNAVQILVIQIRKLKKPLPYAL